MNTSATGCDLIFVSLETWDEVWRRNQFVCAELARRHPDRKILFVGPPLDVSASVRRLDRTHLRTSSAPPSMQNITLTRPLKLLPNSSAAGRKVNEHLARTHVRRMARRLGLRDPILWLNPYDAAHMIGRLGESAAIYDITDDWTKMRQRRETRDRVIRQDRAACRLADAVIVCSTSLFETKRADVRNLHLIPNGVDADHYRRVLDDSSPLPEPADRWTRPVLGYTGTVHTERLDVDLVDALAHRLPRATFVFIGPDHLKHADRARLEARGNVVLHGPVPYDRLPEWMRAFDVCIVPHRVTPFTESLNPIKLWEYLAAGKPIVATDVAGFRDYPRHVRLARDVDAFVRGVQDALAEDATRADQRRAEALTHSWVRRVDAIESVITSCRSGAARRGAEVACA